MIDTIINILNENYGVRDDNRENAEHILTTIINEIVDAFWN